MADSSVLVLEPDALTATAEIDAESMGAGPGGKPLRRERMQLGGAAMAEIARVLNAAPGGGDYGLVTRNIPSGTQTTDPSDRDVRLLGRTKVLDSLGNVIDPTVKAQLPAALTGGGNLKVAVVESTATVTADVSDRDARLAGRVKLFDSLGNVIDPAMKGQLPAALVGGRLDVNLGASGITLLVDPTDKDARILGRAKLLDSTGAVIDPATKGQLPAALVGGRLDDNIGSWMGSTAATVGQKAMASSLPVVLSSDHSSIIVVGDVDHDAINTAKVEQIGGHASPVDVPPTAVSANGDRVRAHLDRYGAVIVRRRKIRESYTAVFRLAEAAARLDQTFTHTANTNKQWATLHHTAGATKEVRLLFCMVWVTTMTTVAPQGIIELRQISAAPATGNPAITPTPHRRGGTAAEAVALYLPTTAGTEANVDRPLGHHVFDEAVSVATVGFAHPQGYGRGGIVLYDASSEDDEMMPAVLPVGTLDGWAVVSRLTGATVTRLTVMMKFTEEIP